MKVDFKDTKVPIDPYTLPLPKLEAFEGKELEEIHERMRTWLKEHSKEREKCLPKRHSMT